MMSILKRTVLVCLGWLLLSPLPVAGQIWRQISGIDKDKLLLQYDSLLQAEKAAVKRRDTVSVISLKAALRSCFTKIGNKEVEKKYLQEALKYASLGKNKNKKDTVDWMQLRMSASSIEVQQRKMAAALSYLNEVYKVLSPSVSSMDSNTKACYVTALYRLSSVYAQMDSFSRAELIAAEAYQMAITPYKEMTFFQKMREIGAEKGDPEQELEYALKYINYIEKQDLIPLDMMMAYGRVGELLYKRGEEKQGIALLEKVSAISLDRYFEVLSLTPVASVEMRSVNAKIKALKMLDSIYTKKNDTKALLENKTRLCDVVEKVLIRERNVNDVQLQNALMNAQLEYYMQEKDAKYRQLVRNSLYGLFVGILLIVIIVIFLRIRVKMSKKNRVIVQLSAARLRQKGIPDTAGQHPESSYRDLFLKIEDAVSRDKSYLNPQLRRKDVAVMIGTNETYIYNAIKENTPWNNFTEYINSYRITLACELIKESPDKKVENIAVESGFISRQTFYRAFYQHLSMTPREYAHLLNSKEPDNNKACD